MILNIFLHHCGEADIWEGKDGRLRILTRSGNGSGSAYYYTGDSSSTKWEEKCLGELVHSPVVVEWKDRYFVAGRGGERGKYDTRLWEIIGDGEGLRHLITLPSQFDCAYPGLLIDPATLDADAPAFFITWYSQHEARETYGIHAAHVYAARISLENM